MTLAEGKRKVYMLLDEYTSGGTMTVDMDIEHKMADFFDMAQKDMAEVRRVVKLHQVERKAGQTEYGMPEDFMLAKQVWAGDEPTHRFRWRAGKIIIPERERKAVSVEYYANPETITPETPDSYVFQIDDDAAQALPFYVAAQQLITDLVIDYGALWNIYLRRKAELAAKGTGERTQLRNVLFRG